MNLRFWPHFDDSVSDRGTVPVQNFQWLYNGLHKAAYVQNIYLYALEHV